MEIEIPLEIEVTISTEGRPISAEIRDILDEWTVSGRKVFQPVQVVVSSPHAEFIEFGTGPAKEGTKPWGQLVMVLEEWVVRKLGGYISWEPEKDAQGNMLRVYRPEKPVHEGGSTYYAGSKKDKIRYGRTEVLFSGNNPALTRKAYAIAKSILEKGIPPQPFFRPAIYETWDKIRNGAEWSDLSEVGIESFYDIAQMIYDRALEIFNDNGTEYGGPYVKKNDKEVKSSLDIRILDGKSSLSDSAELEHEDSFGERYWRPDYPGVNGKWPVNYNKR